MKCFVMGLAASQEWEAKEEQGGESHTEAELNIMGAKEDTADGFRQRPTEDEGEDAGGRRGSTWA